jgi:[ribosomal protein S5]-alanine N-acetyltransferase
VRLALGALRQDHHLLFSFSFATSGSLLHLSCLAFGAVGVAQGLVDLRADPQTVQKHRELPRHGHHRPFKTGRCCCGGRAARGLCQSSRGSRAPCSGESMHPITNKALQTERMVLRLMEMADVDDLIGIFSDPVAMRYYPSTKSRQEAQEWVRRVQESYRDRGFGLWVAVLEDSGEFVGQCGLTVQEVERKNEVEIGYLFLRKFWGRGLATEAARAARDHGFNTLGYERLVSLIDPGNLASRRVAEKVGLTLEKEVEKWGKRICVYAIRKGSLAT